VQRSIFTDYLFKRFFRLYKSFFGATDQTPQTYKNFHKLFLEGIPERHVLSFFLTSYRLSLLNDRYVDFIVMLIKVLEPMRTEPQKVLVKSNRQVETIYFLMNGSIEIGYNSHALMESHDMNSA